MWDYLQACKCINYQVECTTKGWKRNRFNCFSVYNCGCWKDHASLLNRVPEDKFTHRENQTYGEKVVLQSPLLEKAAGGDISRNRKENKLMESVHSRYNMPKQEKKLLLNAKKKKKGIWWNRTLCISSKPSVTFSSSYFSCQICWGNDIVLFESSLHEDLCAAEASCLLMSSVCWLSWGPFAQSSGWGWNILQPREQSPDLAVPRSDKELA